MKRFLFVILNKAKDPLLSLLFCLSFPKGISFYRVPISQPCYVEQQLLSQAIL
jgi:hypothetical protein